MEGFGAAWAPLQAPPPARRDAGAHAPRGLHALAANAAAVCFFVALWLCNATSAAFIAVRRTCGEDSRAGAVAKQLFMAAFVATGLLFYVAALLLLWSIRNGGPKTEAREEEIGSGGQRLPSEGTRAPCLLDGVDPITKHILIFFGMVILLGMLMLVLAPEKESCEGRVGSMLTDIGSFHYSVVFCFVFPNFVFQLRASRAKPKRGTAGFH